ncbi:MAG TPA: hypothetical protein P5186_22250 [Candidatus Paceibacterota bacterium]|nr:hypothetical protein [Verrucomicrobiota bacterium]HRY50782.1 hypothetical protein [Candidatus Paceibacterota bacterium]HSA00079.1 hypothetical protein [Candidatus Paceibacterota bacterium]
MKNIGLKQVEPPAQLIDVRIEKLDNWRDRILSRFGAPIRQTHPEAVEWIGHVQFEAAAVDLLPMNPCHPKTERRSLVQHVACLVMIVSLTSHLRAMAAEAISTPGSKLLPAAADKVITAADLTVERVGTNIPVSAIGEPVGGVTLSPPRWIEATENSVAHALVNGMIGPKADGKD